MEEADESLRNEMMYYCWQTHSLMLSFSLFLPHSHFTSAKAHWDTRLRHSPASRLPAASDICVVIFVPFEQMSLPSILSDDWLFHIYSREQTDADLHRSERKLDSDWYRHQDWSQTWDQGVLIDILCCASSSVVGDHYMPSFVPCRTKMGECHKNKMK